MPETFSQIVCSDCLVVITVQTRREGESKLLKGQLPTCRGQSARKLQAAECFSFSPVKWWKVQPTHTTSNSSSTMNLMVRQRRAETYHGEIPNQGMFLPQQRLESWGVAPGAWGAPMAVAWQGYEGRGVKWKHLGFSNRRDGGQVSFMPGVLILRQVSYVFLSLVPHL